MFLAALSVILLNWKTPQYLLLIEQVNKLQNLRTMEHYAGLLIQGTTWVSLQREMLRAKV